MADRKIELTRRKGERSLLSRSPNDTAAICQHLFKAGVTRGLRSHWQGTLADRHPQASLLSRKAVSKCWGVKGGKGRQSLALWIKARGTGEFLELCCWRKSTREKHESCYSVPAEGGSGAEWDHAALPAAYPRTAAKAQQNRQQESRNSSDKVELSSKLQSTSLTKQSPPTKPHTSFTYPHFFLEHLNFLKASVHHHRNFSSLILGIVSNPLHCNLL